MRKLISVFATLMAAQPLAACPDHQDAIQLIATDTTAPVTYISIAEIPLAFPFDLQVQFCDWDGIDQPELSFDATMPAHKHGMNYLAEVKSVGAGIYEISNVVFHMPGIWQLEIDVQLEEDRWLFVHEVLAE